MDSKDSAFSKKSTINCGGKLLDLSITKVMGILNVTPDSFYDGGQHKDRTGILKYVKKMLKNGADIIDIGGVSTRPGASLIDEKEEHNRVIPVIQFIKKEFPDIILSIDTFRSEIARQALKEGAHIINDISAGNFDKKMFDTVVELNVPYIIMHMQGTPDSMQEEPVYKDVITEVMDFLLEKVQALKMAGVKDIIIDPGFGFGKTVANNYQILKKLDYFNCLNLPILVGISRKSMINNILKTKPKNALNGTTVLNTLALLKGANILRVHDVKEAKEAIKLTDYYRAI